MREGISKIVLIKFDSERARSSFGISKQLLFLIRKSLFLSRLVKMPVEEVLRNRFRIGIDCFCNLIIRSIFWLYYETDGLYSRPLKKKMLHVREKSDCLLSVLCLLFFVYNDYSMQQA